jgi:hypothetical protein
VVAALDASLKKVGRARLGQLINQALDPDNEPGATTE